MRATDAALFCASAILRRSLHVVASLTWYGAQAAACVTLAGVSWLAVILAAHATLVPPPLLSVPLIFERVRRVRADAPLGAGDFTAIASAALAQRAGGGARRALVAGMEYDAALSLSLLEAALPLLPDGTAPASYASFRVTVELLGAPAPPSACAAAEACMAGGDVSGDVSGGGGGGGESGGAVLARCQRRIVLARRSSLGRVWAAAERFANWRHTDADADAGLPSASFVHAELQ